MEAEQKLTLCAEYKKRKKTNAKFSLSDLSKWTKEEFGISTSPHRSTILRIVKNSGIAEKRRRLLNCEALENH